MHDLGDTLSLGSAWYFDRVSKRVWDLPIIDPLLSIGISLFVLWNVIRTLRRFLDVFLQRTPLGFNVDEFETAALAIPGAVSVDHTHSWSIDGESHVLTTHLVLQAGMTREEIVERRAQVRRLLDARTFEHVTIDVVLEGEESEADSHRGSGTAAEGALGARADHGHHHH